MVPRSVVVFVLLFLVLLLGADIIGQLVVPGHTASPVIDGAMLALIGSILAGVKGPKPEPPGPPGPADTPAEPGRHRSGDTP